MIRRIGKSKQLSLVALVVVSMFLSSSLVGCSWISKITGSEDPVKNAYSGMYGTGSVYGMAMTSVSMLQAQGIVSPAQRDIVNKAATIFRASYYVTVDSLGMWKLNQGTPNEAELYTILQNLMFGLTQNWAALQAAINALSPGLIQGDIKLVINKEVTVDSTTNPNFKKAVAAGYKKDPKKLDPTIVPIIISVIGLIVQYGIPEAMKLIEALKKPTITIEDIKALKDLVKDPATY
ncbi:MAG: hypothetical protein EHM49_02505 [Deltaproteobacteria bacterium]|nr:MAG: hypothetical protein EHM49_02505 [Deltaproteobacteria bacterium]